MTESRRGAWWEDSGNNRSSRISALPSRALSCHGNPNADHGSYQLGTLIGDLFGAKPASRRYHQ